MSDFDFDELDRAVSGVIGGESTDEQPKPAPDAPREPSVAAPVSAAVSEGEKPVLSSPITRSAPAARRSSGRFMDMVHPSSDMRTRETPAVIPAPKPEEAAAPSPVAAEPQAPAPVVAEINNDLAAPTEDPLASPFLPDAKVEKRPLGGGAPIAADMKLEDLLDEPGDPLLGTGKQEDLLEAPDDPRLSATTMPDPIDFAESLSGQQEQVAQDEEAATQEDSSLPAHDAPEAALPVDSKESTDESLVLDTSEQQASSDSEKVSQTEASVEAPSSPEQESTPTEELTSENHPELIAATEVEQPTGPTSITQQYTEQPSSKQESGAIYDTESYHQPLAKPAKKHSGLLVIVWILLLVVLGAGAGAAFYIYVLPML